MANYKPTPKTSGQPQVVRVKAKKRNQPAALMVFCTRCGRPKNSRSPDVLCKHCRREVDQEYDRDRQERLSNRPEQLCPECAEAQGFRLGRPTKGICKCGNSNTYEVLPGKPNNKPKRGNGLAKSRRLDYLVRHQDWQVEA